MTRYLNLDDLPEQATAHAAGIKKVLCSGHLDLTRLTQIAWARLQPGEEIAAHKHLDMEEYFLFTKGEGQMIVDDNNYTLKEGIFITVPAGAEHILNCHNEALEFFYFGLQIYSPVHKR